MTVPQFDPVEFQKGVNNLARFFKSATGGLNLFSYLTTGNINGAKVYLATLNKEDRQRVKTMALAVAQLADEVDETSGLVQGGASRVSIGEDGELVIAPKEG